jgi:hypothetical protein
VCGYCFPGIFYPSILLVPLMACEQHSSSFLFVVMW